jgi:hypothetical protein
MTELPENTLSPISRTLPGIMMLDGLTKQQKSFPGRITKLALIVQSEPMMEVRPEPENAEPAIAMTESGRVRVVRHSQHLKRQSGIVVNCDGASNVTEDNLEHRLKTE